MPITTGALALGSTIIGSGGSSDIADLINDYAKGRIICDTSTMQVGDAVRVRSVTTNEYTDKTVTIVGGYLVFNVLCKDYYKICMLQGGGHQITITGYDSEDYVDINIFDGMIGTGLRVYSSITSGAPNDYNGTGINLYFDSNSNKWVLKSTGNIVYQNQQYTSGRTIEEWSGQVNISLEEIPTEIGGVYKTVDYGETLFLNVLDKTTLGGVQGILNAHEELDVLNIGDEVNISVGGNSWTMLIGGLNIYNSHEVILVSKYLLPNSVSVTAGNYANQSIRTKCQDFYDAIDNVDKVYIKKKQITYSIYQQSTNTVEDYCFVPTATELGIGSDSIYTSSGEKSTNSIIPIFYTQNARVKKTAIDEIAQSYVTATHDTRQSQPSVRVDNTGAFANTSGGTYTSYVLPCFRLMADS